jgi:predicted XRE-type DNA-binding protein
MTTKLTPSSGDVFRDIGLSAGESKDLRLRSDLMIELGEQVRALNTSQIKVAERLGITQPRVCNLLKGRIDLFSLDSLVELLGRLGNAVDVSVRRPVREIQSFQTATSVEAVFGVASVIPSSVVCSETVPLVSVRYQDSAGRTGSQLALAA